VRLSRNIIIDGSENSDQKIGGRVIVTTVTEQVNGHDYVREGYGQFSYVGFKGMGQYGYSNFDDLRAQLLLYNLPYNADYKTPFFGHT